MDLPLGTSTPSIRSDAFWAAMDPAEHVVQFYQDDEALLPALEGFVASGLANDEVVVVIATAPHIHALEKALRARWIDVDRARWRRRYIPMLAHHTLARFMVNGWPDEELFRECFLPTIRQAQAEGVRVRGFGEMVALLWAQGQTAATIRLELLWQKLCEQEGIRVLCAYPRAHLVETELGPVNLLCAAHSRVLR